MTQTINNNRGTVLVIDDERDLIELVRYNLDKEGFDVVAATDGTSGLEIATKHKPNLVVLDLDSGAIIGKVQENMLKLDIAQVQSAGGRRAAPGRRRPASRGQAVTAGTARAAGCLQRPKAESSGSEIGQQRPQQACEHDQAFRRTGSWRSHPFHPCPITPSPSRPRGAWRRSS